MKLFLFALAITACLAFTITRNGDRMDFSYSHFGNDSPVDLMLKGHYDTGVDGEKQISAFLNLFGAMFPIVEDVLDAHEDLEYKYNWCSGPGAIEFCWNFEFHFIVGWTVNQVGVDDEYYNITWMPFVNGTASAASSLSTGFVEFFADGESHYFELDIPITFEFEGFRRLCYGAYSLTWPYAVHVTGQNRVRQCQTDLSDFEYNGWSCSWSNPLNITFWDVAEGDVRYKTLTDRVCWHADN